MFVDFVDGTYPIEINDATDTARSTSYLDLHIDIDSEGRLKRNFTTKEII
jgi:hypothetical protein